MKLNLEIKKKIASNWFKFLQTEIFKEFWALERKKSKKSSKKLFKKKVWKKSENKNEGGGTYIIMKNGAVFDSLGINFSEVSGKFQKKFKSQVLGAEKNPNYWASGISVVAHMKNPKIPLCILILDL